MRGDLITPKLAMMDPGGSGEVAVAGKLRAPKSTALFFELCLCLLRAGSSETVRSGCPTLSEHPTHFLFFSLPLRGTWHDHRDENDLPEQS